MKISAQYHLPGGGGSANAKIQEAGVRFVGECGPWSKYPQWFVKFIAGVDALAREAAGNEGDGPIDGQLDIMFTDFGPGIRDDGVPTPDAP